MKHRLLIVSLIVFVMSACASPAPLPTSMPPVTSIPQATAIPPENIEVPSDAFRLVVDRNTDWGGAQSLSEFIVVQGTPWNRYDPFEAQAWKDLQMRAGDTQIMFNDEYYWPEGGIHVIRSTTPPAECASGARGPLGPQGDLWLCTDEFESFLQNWNETLGTDFNQSLSLGVMPRTLSYNPESPNWHSMSPRDNEEWQAVVRETAKYLTEKGWTEPTIWFFGEYENLFYGKDRPLYDGTAANSQARAEDYAELYILTQNALQEYFPNVKLIGATTGTYSRDFTRDLQQNPYALGIEDWLEALQRLDPNFVPSAVGWQGYYWYGLDGFGPNRLLEGAEHIRGILRGLGYRDDIPQYLGGWNGTFGNPEAADGTMTDDARLQKEAAHLASTIIDMLEIGSERRIHTALYYTWNLDGPAFPDYRCGYPYQSLVSTINEGIVLNDPNYPDCDIPPSTIECKRATYHALAFLNDLRGGNFVSTAFAGESNADVSGLRLLATKEQDTTQIVIVHRDGATIPFFHLEVQGLNLNSGYTVTVNTIQAQENVCADVISQSYSVNSNSNGILYFPLPLAENGIMQITIEP